MRLPALLRQSSRGVRPRRKPARPWRRAAALALVALVGAVAVGGCRACRGPVNASPGLRWWLFANFGASRVCPEMLKRGVGLQMQGGRGPFIGRFFPTTCSVDVDGDRQLATVHFTGTGYAWTTVSRRVGFSTTASIEYKPDFYLGENDIYVWGRVNRIVNGPSFRLGYVESQLVDAATRATQLGTFANLFGNQIAVGELTRGFTVVQDWNTESNSFALGILNPPARPHSPFDVSDGEWHTFANETVEVHANQRDYLGPFEVLDSDQRLYMRYFLQGPSVDAMVVSKQVGDAWRDAYQQGLPLGPPPGPVLAGGPLPSGQEIRQSYRVPVGTYYVVIDNTAAAGSVAPPIQPLNPLADPVATLSYVAQLAEE